MKALQVTVYHQSRNFANQEVGMLHLHRSLGVLLLIL